MNDHITIICKAGAVKGWNDTGEVQLQPIYYEKEVHMSEPVKEHAKNFVDAMMVCGCSREQIGAAVINALLDTP